LQRRIEVLVHRVVVDEVLVDQAPVRRFDPEALARGLSSTAATNETEEEEEEDASEDLGREGIRSTTASSSSWAASGHRGVIAHVTRSSSRERSILNSIGAAWA
jgi:hypothetical protein